MTHVCALKRWHLQESFAQTVFVVSFQALPFVLVFLFLFVLFILIVVLLVRLGFRFGFRLGCRRRSRARAQGGKARASQRKTP